MSSRDSDTRRRRKDYDRDRDRDRDRPRSKDRDKDRDRDRPDRHKSSKSSRKPTSTSSKDKERDREYVARERSSISAGHSRSTTKVNMVVPELDRRSSLSGSDRRSSVPYPSFSKAHSKEAVGSRENVVNPRLSLYTPDPTNTDLGQEQKMDGGGRQEEPGAGGAPPSPPLTTTEPDLRRASSGGSMRRRTEALRTEAEGGRRNSADSERRSALEPRLATSRSSLRKAAKTEERSELSKASSGGRDSAGRSRTPENESHVTETSMQSASSPSGIRSQQQSTVTQDTASTPTAITTDSDATTVPPERKPKRHSHLAPLQQGSSPSTYNDSSPRTPTPRTANFPPVEPEVKEPAIVEIVSGNDSQVDGIEVPDSFPSSVPPSAGFPPPPPPPPPPPAAFSGGPPRVDYLLQNGGLSQLVPRNFASAAGQGAPIQAYHQYMSPRPGSQMPSDIRGLFTPLHQLLDDYSHVMTKHGSIAVATGYRSVARRLLDRLEAVFARNISSETCSCIMCRNNPPSMSPDEDTGISWGEILEFVGGRRELPQWPPFTIDAEASGLGISSSLETKLPMQKLDIDVPDEYRDHYIRQNKKTKNAVQNWLASQPEMPSSPPDEIDDETMTFAMLTYLEPEKRPLFTALLRGLSNLPSSRAPTPMDRRRPDLMIRTGLALQRLYRLAKPARDPECAIYLLKNPDLHGVLATLAAVSNGEWEVLISGRFDGFLWSGAETPLQQPGFTSPPPRSTATPASRVMSPFSANGGPSRGPAPFSPFSAFPPGGQRIATPAGLPSRGPTPALGATVGAPVPMDEETEIAVLAEVEREIFLGMEALEDAFEALHMKAETVRTALRDRAAGLQMAANARRGSGVEGIEVRLGTPASAAGGAVMWPSWDGESEDDAWGDDGRSELAPDDSASQIHYSGKRRKHRKERRTPAPVEEENEGDSIIDVEDERRR